MHKIKITLHLDRLLLEATSIEVDSLRKELEIENGTSISRLLERIGLRSDLISFVVVNGSRKDLDHELENNDTVALFPYIIGG